MDNLGLNNNNYEKYHYKRCALFLSEFSYTIIACLIALIGIIFPSYYKTTEYTSYSGPSWNSSSDPLLFTHISDIHVSSIKSKEKFKTLFRTVKKLGANFHLFTGDLVDNYEKKDFPKIGKQMKQDMEYYKELLDTILPNETIIDVSGNHDMFGVISPFDDDFGFLDISRMFTRNNTKTLEELSIKTKNIDGMNFILLNPYNFPVGHPPYVYYAHPTLKFLDLLEEKINQIGPCSILMHYPADFFWSKGNSNGKDFETLMKHENVQYIFSGHTHPIEFKIRHHEKGGLEFIGTAIKKTNDFALVTIDNGRLVYNRVEFKDNNFKYYYMTYPVPKDQLSKNHNFNEKNTEIRVISYKNEIEDNLNITGDFNGKLIYQRELKNGAKLYSMPLNIINNGEYKIKFEAPGYAIEREFYVGEKITIQGEKKNFFNYILIPFIIAISFLIIFLLIITFPKRIVDFSFIDEWILDNKEGKWFYWIISILLNPFILNYRINTNNPLYFRIILFICFCYPLILPFHFFEPMKGYIGYSFFCFYLINKTVLYDEWSLFFTTFFFVLIILPVTLVVSSFKFRKSCFFIFHFVFLYLFFGVACFINYRFVGESVKFELLFCHPCLVIIPVILNILMYVSLYRYNKLMKTEENIFDNENVNININSDIISRDTE